MTLAKIDQQKRIRLFTLDYRLDNIGYLLSTVSLALSLAPRARSLPRTISLRASSACPWHCPIPPRISSLVKLCSFSSPAGAWCGIRRPHIFPCALLLPLNWLFCFTLASLRNFNRGPVPPHPEILCLLLIVCFKGHFVLENQCIMIIDI